MNSKPPKGTTTDRLRHEIDRGATSDKVPYPDPAAAPLGTDDEAAGTPAAPELVEAVRARETGRPVDHRPIVQGESDAQPRRSLYAGLAIAAAVIVALAASLYWSEAIIG